VMLSSPGNCIDVFSSLFEFLTFMGLSTTAACFLFVLLQLLVADEGSTLCCWLGETAAVWALRCTGALPHQLRLQQSWACVAAPGACRLGHSCQVVNSYSNTCLPVCVKPSAQTHLSDS
jgi:hypothetical protein